MIKISTPATSANLKVGFDALGIAFDLYNEFEIEENTEYKITGFKEEFNNNKNIVLTSYVAFAKKYLNESEIKKVHINLVNELIPISRGLGSSASCILAGVLAANEINQLQQSYEICASFASTIEGHPDNVFASCFGNLTASMIATKGYIHEVFEIHKDYHFTLLVPEAKASTETLRKAIKKEVSLNDTVFHLSRMIHVPTAFKNNNITQLKEVLQDKLHEQYRTPFIPDFDKVKELEDEQSILCVSGSGSTLLFISTNDITQKLNKLTDTFKILEVNISNGVIIEVI